jgi:hypothetical protein
MFKKRKKYYAIFCVKQHGVFRREGKKRVSPSNPIVRRKKKSFIVNFGFPTYSRGLKDFYFIDIDFGQIIAKNTNIKKVLNAKAQVLFKGDKDKPLLNPKMLDLLISQRIVKQLTSNLSDTAWKMNMITLVLGLIIGGLSGYILAGYV